MPTFVRVIDGPIVNLDQIATIEENKDGTLKLNVIGANTVPVTDKNQASDIRNFINKNLLGHRV